MPCCSTQVPGRGVCVAAGRAGLPPRDLTPRPGTPEVDRPTWTVVLRPCLLEVVQHVLRAVSRPHREKTMIVVLEGPAATHGDEPRIPDLGEDHQVASLALASAKGSGIGPRRGFRLLGVQALLGAQETTGCDVDRVPEFSYDLLWLERGIRSVANFTRTDAREFLELALSIPIRTAIQTSRWSRAMRLFDAFRRATSTRPLSS